MKTIKRSTWKYGLLLFFGVMARLVFPFEKISTDSSGIGILTIQNFDSTVNIFIDGKLIKYLAVQKHFILSGKHVIQLTPPDRSIWRIGDWKKEFEIAAGESLTIKIPEIKYIYINSIPFDATVMLNDSISGKTPLFMTIIDPIDNFLKIQKSGYQVYVIKISDLKTNYLNIKLEKEKEIEEINFGNALNLRNRQIQKKFLTYSMIGLTLISGITTIYLRQEADQYYDKYLSAGQPTEMDHFYSETKKYDGYAAFTYGTFQLSFITSLYLLFKR